MARGNGQAAQQARKAGKLSAYVTPSSNNEESNKNTEYVDYKEMDTDLIAATVWAVNKLGGSVLFGHSRDKSCYSCVIFDGGDKKSYYFPCSMAGVTEFEEFMNGLIAIADMEE